MKKNILLTIVIITSLLFGFWFFCLKDKRKEELMIKGNELIEKVEKYKTINHKLPDSLFDLGIKENEITESQFSYEKKDSTHYFIWLGISSEESKFYYSDTKKWENIYREMK
ncbi:hypothetical protein OQX63_11365 [Pedobacter sp. PF22-3]|uniref:hypothetical protein n=1 Tax=Pedobacter sp. PF22-3 TaxID=2994467 RepID=UPI00104F7186|nr:hypothetical protein [Pedobacter sp. PF22-3]MCX2494074.1 hypothetical protein [Pedobacter sp. PF22-3]